MANQTKTKNHAQAQMQLHTTTGSISFSIFAVAISYQNMCDIVLTFVPFEIVNCARDHWDKNSNG